MGVATATLVAAGVTAVGSYAASRSKQKADQRMAEQQMAMSAEESERSMQRTAYQMGLEDYYNRRDRFEASRGMEEFRKFSTVHQFAPDYVRDTGPMQAPTMPTPADYAPQPEAEVAEQGGSSGSKNLLSKRVSLHKKARDPLGLF